MLLYVDDMIITGSDNIGISNLIRHLATCFDMKDLGLLHFFLGMEVHRSHDSLLLTQQKYALELLQHTDMLGAKPVSTPVQPGLKLSAHDGHPLSDVTKYRSITDAL